MLEQLIALQRWIYAALSADMSAFAATRDWLALAAIIPTGVVFGAIHALTPATARVFLPRISSGHVYPPCARLPWLPRSR